MYESSKQSYCLDGITATEAGCTKGRVFNPGTQQCDSPQNVPGKLDLSKKKPADQCSVQPIMIRLFEYWLYQLINGQTAVYGLDQPIIG